MERGRVLIDNRMYYVERNPKGKKEEPPRESNQDFAKRMMNGYLSSFEFTVHSSKTFHALIFRRFMIYFDSSAVLWRETYQKFLDQHTFPQIPMLCLFSTKSHFIVPEFVLQKYLPDSSDWVWQPSVQLSMAQFRRQLVKEQHFGGWPTNAKGQALIPKRTGRMGERYEPPFDSGWAVERPGYVERIRFTASDA